MDRRWRLVAILVSLIALALVGSLVLAAADSILHYSLLSSGGGIIEGDGLVLNSAIGQPVGGLEGGGSGEFTLCSGFICAETFQVEELQGVFLPFVINGGQ